MALGLPVIVAFWSEYGLFIWLEPVNICLLTIALYSAFMASALSLCGGLSGVSRRVKFWGAVIAAPYALFSYLSYTVTGQGQLYQYVLSVIGTACVLFSCAMILPHLYRAGHRLPGAAPEGEPA